MKLKGAIFDCDGTLVDSLGFWNIYYDKMGEHFFGGEHFKPEDVDDKTMRTQPVSFGAKLLHDKYGVGDSADEVAAWIIELFDWFYRECVELKLGVRELLEELKSRGVRMCIASAAEPDLIRLVLGKHGVLEYFERIVTSTDVGAGKDKPDVFLEAERLLETPHEETWVLSKRQNPQDFTLWGCMIRSRSVRMRRERFLTSMLTKGLRFQILYR